VIRGGDLIEQSLVARRIGNIALITVASPDYLRRHGVPAHPNDLEQGHQTVNYFSARTGRQYPHEFVKGDEHIEISGRHRLSVNEANAVTEAVLAGLGISQIGSFGAAPLLANGTLIQLLKEWTHPPIPVYVVYPPNRHLSAKVRAFVDWAAELFAGNPLLQGR